MIGAKLVDVDEKEAYAGKDPNPPVMLALKQGTMPSGLQGLFIEAPTSNKPCQLDYPRNHGLEDSDMSTGSSDGLKSIKRRRARARATYESAFIPQDSPYNPRPANGKRLFDPAAGWTSFAPGLRDPSAGCNPTVSHGNESKTRPDSHSRNDPGPENVAIPSRLALGDSQSTAEASATNQSSLSWPVPAQLVHNEMDLKLLPQLRTQSITHQQLSAEGKGIYAGLVMAGAKCIDVDEKQALTARIPNRQTKSTSEQWLARIIALHKTLLHEHHDFFLAYHQHSSASPARSRLAAKYPMPARMWRDGIHTFRFLEVLRQRLPDSLDTMLALIYKANPMMAQLYGIIPNFGNIWISHDSWGRATGLWYNGVVKSYVCQCLSFLAGFNILRNDNSADLNHGYSGDSGDYSEESFHALSRPQVIESNGRDISALPMCHEQSTRRLPEEFRTRGQELTESSFPRNFVTDAGGNDDGEQPKRFLEKGYALELPPFCFRKLPLVLSPLNRIPRGISLVVVHSLTRFLSLGLGLLSNVSMRRSSNLKPWAFLAPPLILTWLTPVMAAPSERPEVYRSQVANAKEWPLGPNWPSFDSWPFIPWAFLWLVICYIAAKAMGPKGGLVVSEVMMGIFGFVWCVVRTRSDTTAVVLYTVFSLGIIFTLTYGYLQFWERSNTGNYFRLVVFSAIIFDLTVTSYLSGPFNDSPPEDLLVSLFLPALSFSLSFWAHCIPAIHRHSPLIWRCWRSIKRYIPSLHFDSQERVELELEDV